LLPAVFIITALLLQKIAFRSFITH